MGVRGTPASGIGNLTRNLKCTTKYAGLERRAVAGLDGLGATAGCTTAQLCSRVVQYFRKGVTGMQVFTVGIPPTGTGPVPWAPRQTGVRGSLKPFGRYHVGRGAVPPGELHTVHRGQNIIAP